MPSISLCIITLNEEKFLRQCLESVKDLVDEIIIVDTGSIDKTIDIAKEFTDKVYEFPWCDDFARARNESLKYATKDWILVLDADEVISERDHDKIRNIIRREDIDGYALLQRNYVPNSARIGFIPSDDYKECEDYPGFFNIPVVRLFRNKGYRFEYRIHEVIDRNILSKGGTITKFSIPIHHYNFIDETSVAEKREKYLNIALEQIRMTPEDPKPYYEAGEAYINKEEFIKAKEMLNKAINLDEHYRTPYMELARVAMHQNNEEMAIKLLKKQLELKKNNINTMNLLAKTLAGKRKFDEASQVLLPAVEKDNPTSANLLFNMLMQQHKVLQAIKLMQFRIEKDPDFMPAYNNMAFALISANKVDEAITVLEKAVSRGVRNAATARIIINLAGLLAKKGQVEGARALIKENASRYPSFSSKFRRRLDVLAKIR